MKEVVSIQFINSNRLYYFDSNKIELNDNDKVIVETEKGLQYGTVINSKLEISEKKLVLPLKKVIRKANKEDLKQQETNEKDSKKALKKAIKIAQELDLKMNIISATFTFDRKELMFNFLADDRIDFRELAKKLAAIYKTRIELRQIGIRDKAKEIGGIGPCGRFLCCSTFLNDFSSVSINMAKNQYIALNPTKINGACGRLLCCFNYEDEQYLEMKKDYPAVGSSITIDGEKAKVITHNLFKGSYVVEKSNKEQVEIFLDESSK
ncbi:MAG: stage 0 sporulation family protein [Bacilli bacterium]|nr:stage 0 sporulation family protein [Bacilli bacterium]